MAFDLFPDMIQHAPAAKPAVKQVIVHAKPVVHTIQTGFSMLTLIISNVVTAAVSAGLGWYVKGRGMTGVKNDINNVKTEVENLKNMVRGAPSA